jgi:hypothetical protein
LGSERTNRGQLVGVVVSVNTSALRSFLKLVLAPIKIHNGGMAPLQSEKGFSRRPIMMLRKHSYHDELKLQLRKYLQASEQSSTPQK